MIAVIIVVPPHELPSWAWLLMLPIFALQTLLNLGITFVTARIGYHFPDVSNLLGVVSRFLMYISGVGGFEGSSQHP